MNANPLILGTRGSALALAQTTLIRARLHAAFPRLDIEVKIIKTSGDQRTTIALARSGIKGLFTKELESALLRNKIQAAIHSLKDVPADLPGGLILGAVAEREDACDVLVAHPATPIDAPRVVYTSSPRRTFQARLLWPECETREIRGNVETRLRKLAGGKAGDALLLAAAGLRRLDYLRGDETSAALRFDPSLPCRRLTLDEMIPSPGQAAIALEIRADDGETQEKLRAVNHAPTWAAITAERAFLRRMGGGCAKPIAAHATVDLNGLRLRAIVEHDDRRIWRGEKNGERRNAEAIGESLAQECLAASKRI